MFVQTGIWLAALVAGAYLGFLAARGCFRKKSFYLLLIGRSMNDFH